MNVALGIGRKIIYFSLSADSSAVGTELLNKYAEKDQLIISPLELASFSRQC
jgi:hypothetical protein